MPRGAGESRFRVGQPPTFGGGAAEEHREEPGGDTVASPAHQRHHAIACRRVGNPGGQAPRTRRGRRVDDLPPADGADGAHRAEHKPVAAAGHDLPIEA